MTLECEWEWDHDDTWWLSVSRPDFDLYCARVEHLGYGVWEVFTFSLERGWTRNAEFSSEDEAKRYAEVLVRMTLEG